MLESFFCCFILICLSLIMDVTRFLRTYRIDEGRVVPTLTIAVAVVTVGTTRPSSMR